LHDVICLKVVFPVDFPADLRGVFPADLRGFFPLILRGVFPADFTRCFSR
jgi:hypothetical protein